MKKEELSHGEKKILSQIESLKTVILSSSLSKTIDRKEESYRLEKTEAIHRLSNLTYLIVGAFLGSLIHNRNWLGILIICNLILIIEIIRILLFKSKKINFLKLLKEGKQLTQVAQEKIKEEI